MGPPSFSPLRTFGISGFYFSTVFLFLISVNGGHWPTILFDYCALNVGKLLWLRADCFFSSRLAAWIASNSFASDMICCIMSATAGSELKSNRLFTDSFSIEFPTSLGICSLVRPLERLRPQPVKALQNGRFARPPIDRAVCHGRGIDGSDRSIRENLVIQKQFVRSLLDPMWATGWPSRLPSLAFLHAPWLQHHEQLQTVALSRK